MATHGYDWRPKTATLERYQTPREQAVYLLRTLGVRKGEARYAQAFEAALGVARWCPATKVGRVWASNTPGVRLPTRPRADQVAALRVALADPTVLGALLTTIALDSEDGATGRLVMEMVDTLTWPPPPTPAEVKARRAATVKKAEAQRAKSARRSLAVAQRNAKKLETKLRKARARVEHWGKRVAYYEGKGL